VRFYNAEMHDIPTAPTKYGKRCTMVRLYMPRYFPKLRRLLDMDTLVLNSLKPLYYDLPVPVIAMGENDRNFYHRPSIENCPTWSNGSTFTLTDRQGRQTCYYGKHGLNAGVLMINLEGWRRAGLDKQVDLWSQRLATGKITMRLNDQDVLNAMVLEHEDYFTPLPCEYNGLFSHRWMCFFAGGSWAAFEEVSKGVLKRNTRKPVVLHDHFGDGRYHQSWRFLRSQALAVADLVNKQGFSNSSSLCSAFSCEGLLAEEAYNCPCRPGPDCQCTGREYYVESNEYPHIY